MASTKAADTKGRFPFPIKQLENSRVILRPFDFSTDADLFVQGTKNNPELFDYVAYGPFQTTEQYYEFYDKAIIKLETTTLFSIFAKSEKQDQPETFAGVVAFHDANAANASIEIGHICILPTYHRTHVTSNTVGLLLCYALDAPPHGLGLRRCQWKAHNGNAASKRTALRMKFEFEGVLRFHVAYPAGKIGNGFDTSAMPEVEGRKLGPARDSAMFSLCCDEWPVKRGQVVEIMERLK